jgi:hypothetical protein
VGALGVAAVLPLALYLWGFMVDDALITARYAANIAAGHGYRFNVGGPSTDGVTPLGFAYFLAPYASDGVMGAFRAAKLLGVITWCAAGALIALAIDSMEGSSAKWIGLVLLGTSAPLAAWSVAGMETGLVIGLAGITAASRALGRETACCVAAALVGAWRPEAIPWAVVIALAPARRSTSTRRGDRGLTSRWLKLGIVAGPAALVAAIRLVAFGHAMPLAAIAKPPSVRHGALYAVACAILCGLIALLAVRRVPQWARGLQLAVLVHWLAMAVAGGDWMPVSRLATTALPTLAIAAAAVAARAPGKHVMLDRAWLLVRSAVAIAGQLFVVISHGPNLADTESQRFAVIDAFGEQLRGAKAVAALDIGWVGATTPATVVDLAGVTDPQVAVLRGGHTSKRIPTWFLDAREVDTLVVRLRPGEKPKAPWYTSRFATFVDMWVSTTPNVAEGFEVVATYDHEPRYVLLQRIR